jgi:peptidylprolyl isomerase
MTLKLTSLLALSLASLTLPFSTRAATASDDTAIIAKVGDSEVRADDIKPLLANLPVRDQLALAHDPAALNELVRSFIVQQLVYKEAVAKKWEQQPQVAAQLERLRQQAVTQTYLQALATPPADYPSDADLQAAYDLLKKNNALQVPKQYHVSQIYIADPKGSDKATDEKAQSKLDAVQKALKSADFAGLAKTQSDEAASAARGGDLGWLAENQIQPEIKARVITLSKGSVTEAIRTTDGWHIIKLIETKEPYIASLDEVKVPLTNELRKERAQAISKAYLTDLLKQNPVTLNEIAVSKLVEAPKDK